MGYNTVVFGYGTGRKGIVMQILDKNLEFQFISFVLIVMVYSLFLSRKKLGIVRERVFALMLGFSMISQLLDMASAVMVFYQGKVYEEISNFVRALYLVSVVFVAFAIVMYVLAEVYQAEMFENPVRYVYMIPIAAAIPLIFNLPISQESETYAFGPAVYISICFSGLYIFICLIYALKNKKMMVRHRFRAVILAAMVFFFCGLFQLHYQNYRLISLGISLLLVYMYLGLENPDEYMDKAMNVFNGDALKTYIKNRCGEKKKLSLLYIYISDFTHMRDTTGTEVSAGILKAAAAYFESLGVAKNIFMIGAAEFVLSFEDDHYFFDAVEKVRHRFGETWDIGQGGQILEIEMNASYIVYPSVRMSNEPSYDEIQDTMQYYMMKIKKSNTNQYICIDRKQLREKESFNNVRSVIFDAIKTENIFVYYQPVFSVRDGCFCELEALMRIMDRRGIFLDDDMVVPVAEQNGIIIQLGFILFEKVCLFIKDNDLKKVGIERISINLSVIQCQQRNLAQELINIMDKYGVSASNFKFEISELTAGYVTKNMRRNINQLIAQGASIAVDDFSGAAIDVDKLLNVSREYVKLGRRLIQDYFSGKKSHQSMKLLCRQFQQLHMSVTAVGVENQQQFAELKKLGIGYMQGMVFYMPMPDSEVLSVIERDIAKGLGQTVLYERIL